MAPPRPVMTLLLPVTDPPLPVMTPPLPVLAAPQDRQSDRHKEPRVNLRPPSNSATYATVSAWHHHPDKLILDSCGYEATVSSPGPPPPHTRARGGPRITPLVTFVMSPLVTSQMGVFPICDVTSGKMGVFPICDVTSGKWARPPFVMSRVEKRACVTPICDITNRRNPPPIPPRWMMNVLMNPPLDPPPLADRPPPVRRGVDPSIMHRLSPPSCVSRL